MEAFALIAIMALAQTDGVDPPPAKDNGRLILDLSLGGSWFDDILGEDIDPGAFGSIGIGYEWNVTDTGAVSVELEYSQHNGDSSGSTTFGGGTLSRIGQRTVAWDGDVRSQVLMINGMWTQTLWSEDHNGFLVYGGAGVGYADNEVDVDFTFTRLQARSDTRRIGVSDSGFAWQVLGGIGWRFDAHSKVYLGGRYADLGTLNDGFDIDVESLVFEIGYSYSF